MFCTFCDFGWFSGFLRFLKKNRIFLIFIKIDLIAFPWHMQWLELIRGCKKAIKNFRIIFHPFLQLLRYFFENLKNPPKSQKSQKMIFSKVLYMTFYDEIWSEMWTWGVLKPFYGNFWYLNVFRTILGKIDFLVFLDPKRPKNVISEA